MKKITWGGKISWEPIDRLTLKMNPNDFMASWKTPANSIKGFLIKNSIWEAKIAWEPRDRLTPKMALKYLLHTWRLPPTLGGTMGRVLVMLGPFQTQSNVRNDEKTTGNIIQ